MKIVVTLSAIVMIATFSAAQAQSANTPPQEVGGVVDCTPVGITNANKMVEKIKDTAKKTAAMNEMKMASAAAEKQDMAGCKKNLDMALAKAK